MHGSSLTAEQRAFQPHSQKIILVDKDLQNKQIS